MKTIQKVIAVGSGKGGVGKSTVAVNLALALKKEGYAVGLLDTDIYGPSIPIMLGVKDDERPKIAPGDRITPIERFGIPLMSMGFLMKPDEAVVWRGPMLSKMLKQFLEQVDWGQLDYLILDLPPGTGDVQISLAQMIPLSGAVVVTTPQDVALADVKRAVKMLKMTNVPILGVVENMSGFECPHCHERSAIFGGSPDKSKYAGFETEFLGELPLESATRVAGDEGQPIVVREPDSKQAERFRGLARRIVNHPALKEATPELEMPVLH